MMYANQTEFFLSDECIPRNLRIRCRKRFEALQQEKERISLLIKWLKGDKDYEKVIAAEEARLSKIDEELLELCNYIID